MKIIITAPSARSMGEQGHMAKKPWDRVWNQFRVYYYSDDLIVRVDSEGSEATLTAYVRRKP